jgi:hypothetical protein
MNNLTYKILLGAHEHRPYHLGIKKWVDSSSLSRANEKRNCQIFADFDNYLIRLVRPLYARCPIPNVDIDNEVFALGSTTISASINLFTRAEGRMTLIFASSFALFFSTDLRRTKL